MTANILVVDDLDTNIKILEAKLHKEYYIVYTASSGKAALEILKHHKIDVILLDCMMPELDGFETCKIIKGDRDTSHIPVVIVTALYDIEDRIKGLQAGADEFLTKPVKDEALFPRLKSLSHMKHIIDELKLRNATNTQLGLPVAELTYDFSNSNILIVNDDALQAKHIAMMLTRLTPNIRIAENNNALDDLLNEKFIPDLTILSCQIENHDPLRFLAKLKTNQYISHSSIIMLAEEESMHIVIKALDLGACDYFMMPIDVNELIARVKTQLQRKHYTESLKSDIEVGMNLSTKDGLSNLYNRRYFDIYAPRLIAKALLDCSPLYVLMIDIDNFKGINDFYGHQKGDFVIKKVAQVLSDNLEVTDLVARYGGEEFIVILSNISSDIMDIANRIRKAINKHFDSPDSESELEVTVSIGATALVGTDDVISFVSRADQALYQAKRGGRNAARFL